MSIVCQYDDGTVAWTEFECSSCGCHLEYVATDQKPVLVAADEGTDFPCPNCNVILPLHDITFEEANSVNLAAFFGIEVDRFAVRNRVNKEVAAETLAAIGNEGKE